jgi:hypothetical protein
MLVEGQAVDEVGYAVHAGPASVGWCWKAAVSVDVCKDPTAICGGVTAERVGDWFQPLLAMCDERARG